MTVFGISKCSPEHLAVDYILLRTLWARGKWMGFSPAAAVRHRDRTGVIPMALKMGKTGPFPPHFFKSDVSAI